MRSELAGVKRRLDEEAAKRNNLNELHLSRPDPIMPAREHFDEYIALLCALFGYGRADSIIKFLYSLDFSLLDGDEDTMQKELSPYYYRFQNSQDVIEIFKTLRRLKEVDSLESLFYAGYNAEQSVMSGLNAVITTMKNINPYTIRC